MNNLLICTYVHIRLYALDTSMRKNVVSSRGILKINSSSRHKNQ